MIGSSDLLLKGARIGKSILTLNRDREYRNLANILDLNSTDTLLDVGCGDGYWTLKFANHCFKTIGLDPDINSLQYGRKFHSRENIKYVGSVAELIPFKDGIFDRLVSISALEHFSDPEISMHEFLRVLKPGGKLAISIDSLSAENSSSSFRKWHQERFFVNTYFSESVILSKLEKVGFHPDTTSIVHLIRSRFAARLREIFIRNPRLWLPLFPVFYGLVRLSDREFDNMPGQIIVMGATR